MAEVKKLDEHTKRRIKSLCMSIIYAKPKDSLISRKEMLAHTMNNCESLRSYNTDVHRTISGVFSYFVYNKILIKYPKKGYYKKIQK
ncbi:hypothetical protein BF503P2_00031 [Bacteroides phage BF503P2]|nr:hypothetical protein BF503P2_00031 [Bacteroides phage BF503P2]